MELIYELKFYWYKLGLNKTWWAFLPLVLVVIFYIISFLMFG